MQRSFVVNCLLLIPLIAALQAAALQPTPVRQADAGCARCHEKIFRSYLATPMANASGLAMVKLRLGTFVHSRSGTEYKVTARNNQGTLSISQAS